MQCTSHLGMDIDCKFIADHLPMKVRFDPYLPHKISVFLDEPKTRFTIFRRRGKMVILGGKCVADATIACEKLVADIQFWAGLLSHPLEQVQYHPPTVNNIVTAGYLGSKMNLGRMAFDYDDAIYELEQFPGLRYKGLIPGNSSVTTSIFNSGRLILTGCKNEEQIYTAWEKLKQITTPYLRDQIVNVTQWE